MEGHVALVVLPHSARWDEGRGQPQSQVSSQFFSLSAGAPLPLFSLLQDVWPETWPLLAGRLLDWEVSLGQKRQAPGLGYMSFFLP